MTPKKPKNTWKTRRQKLIDLLVNLELSLDLTAILREFEYTSKRALINDLRSIKKTLRHQGIILKWDPPYCESCGFIFKNKKVGSKIPSKCPSCKNERIAWPSIKVKRKSY